MKKSFTVFVSTCLVLLAHFDGAFANYVIRESAIAHQLLDGLCGIEIGASAHNPFGLNTLNVDFSNDMNTIWKISEKALTGYNLRVDIVAPGDDLPFKDNTWDFVLASHVIEHFYDPISAIEEWLRVVKPGGFVFMVVPYRDRIFDRDRPITTIAELIERNNNPIDPALDDHHHWSVWRTMDFVLMCDCLDFPVHTVLDVDDKDGIGFIVVLQKKR